MKGAAQQLDHAVQVVRRENATVHSSVAAGGILGTGELEHVAVGVRHVQGALAPRPVGGRSQRLHACGLEPLVLGVRVCDEEGDLSLGPRHRVGGARRPISSGRCGRA